MTFIIAIDGPSASGKGTISQILSKNLGFEHFNTGILYRMVAFHVLKKQMNTENLNELQDLIRSLDFSSSDDLPLQSHAVSNMSSIIAVIPLVRQELLGVQRRFVLGKKGVIVEGRDIGTVIFPGANVKIYITATCEERARRRFKQLQSKGENIIYDNVLRDVKERDTRDLNRASAPLTQGSDYKVIDTTLISIEEAVSEVTALVSQFWRTF